jgi:hypothetical protein
MNNNNLDIQQAMSDIALIRQVLHKTEQEQVDSKLVGITLDANMLLQGIAFLGAFILCLVEVFSNNSMTQTLILGSQIHELNIFGIGFMGATLAGLLIGLYFILWRAAKHNGEEINAYITRNFKHMKNMSFISDLLMKFIALSLVLLAGKPEWIAPLLTAFTGDYLLQNRFFTLPTKVSAVLGIACIGVALTLFFTGNSSLVIPLAILSAISGVSLARLVMRYKTLEAPSE